MPLEGILPMLSIRPAHAGDVPVLNTLIHELADFERLPRGGDRSRPAARWILRARQSFAR